MVKKYRKNSFLSGVSPWIIIGTAALLMPLFSYMTFETIKRQRDNSVRLLLEKGAALIRAFEAGTRSGLEGSSFSGRQLQNLLTETALQNDIAYLLVVDTSGVILAHNDPAQIGKSYGSGLNLRKVIDSNKLIYRTIQTPSGSKIFEVIHKFAPVTKIPSAVAKALKMFQQLCRPHLPNWRDIKPSQFVIFIGMDMTGVEEAVEMESRQAIIMGAAFLLIGFTGIVLLFFTQSYRAARSSLSRIKAFSDNIVENMPIGLIALDDQKRIASFNHVAESLFPLLSVESLQKEVDAILPRAFWELIEHPDIQDGIVECEISCPLGDNRYIPMDISSTQLFDENQLFLGYIFLFKDLSEIQSLRKEIERNQRLAAVGRLAAGVAHEIRNPLSSLKGFATYLQEKYREVPKDQKVTEIMIQEVDRLNRVVSQLLELSKPIDIKLQWCDIKQLIKDTLKLLASRAESQNTIFETDLGNIGENVLIDPDKISQVLLNLLLNAIEAIGEGGKITVRLMPEESNHGICMVVRDTGPGISEADRPHIFDPFFTTKNTGTGLGLAIVHNIVEAHKGIIKVVSGLIEGTQIEIHLPASVNQEATTIA